MATITIRLNDPMIISKELIGKGGGMRINGEEKETLLKRYCVFRGEIEVDLWYTWERGVVDSVSEGMS